MGKKTIFHCNQWAETLRTEIIQDYQGEVGIKAEVDIGLCRGGSHSAFAVRRYDANNVLLDEATDFDKITRMMLDAALKDINKASRPKNKKPSKKPTGCGPQVCEYTLRVNRSADSEALHRYLRKLDNLPEIKPQKGKLMASDLLAIKREQWSRMLKKIHARRCG